MSRAISRGALIVFEGCDRSGKSTQCKKLVDALNGDGIKAKLLRFPGRAITRESKSAPRDSSRAVAIRPVTGQTSLTLLIRPTTRASASNT